MICRRKKMQKLFMHDPNQILDAYRSYVTNATASGALYRI